MSKVAREIPQDLLSNYDVMFMFRRSLQQIYRWRKWKGMPCYKLSTGSMKMQPVRYSLSEILVWAEEKGIKVERRPTIEEGGKVRWPKTCQREFQEFKEAMTF